MLSILIPTYNYNIVPLVLELQKQCLECKIDFEIIVFDDCSKSHSTENKEINSFKNCRFEKLEKNIGRSAIRNLLAKTAQFENLLFLDADTIPIHTNFIQKYCTQIDKKEKVVFGGIEYQKERPEKSKLLRWIYGNARESLSVEKRKKNPNISALTSNLLIRKAVFLQHKFDESIIKYGYEDLLFLATLKMNGIIVKHIDNPTFHLGLEISQEFLNKTKIALENLKSLTETSSLDSSESKILSSYFLFNKLRTIPFIIYFFNTFEKKITINLLSDNPSLVLFDLYKLGYFCKLQSK